MTQNAHFPSGLCTVHCTHCTLHTKHTAHCTLDTLHTRHTAHTTHCKLDTLHAAHCILHTRHTAHWTARRPAQTQRARSSLQLTVPVMLYTQGRIAHHDIHDTERTFPLWTVHCTLYTLHTTHCTLDCTLACTNTTRTFLTTVDSSCYALHSGSNCTLRHLIHRTHTRMREIRYGRHVWTKAGPCLDDAVRVSSSLEECSYSFRAASSCRHAQRRHFF